LNALFRVQISGFPDALDDTVSTPSGPEEPAKEGYSKDVIAGLRDELAHPKEERGTVGKHPPIARPCTFSQPRTEGHPSMLRAYPEVLASFD
jgi:hypothetical protein